MSLETILIVLLVWTGTGLLAAIAFGKVIRENNSAEDEVAAPAAGSVSYLRKHERKASATPVAAPKSRQSVTKRAAN